MVYKFYKVVTGCRMPVASQFKVRHFKSSGGFSCLAFIAAHPGGRFVPHLAGLCHILIRLFCSVRFHQFVERC
jgi:hypothetical protein